MKLNYLLLFLSLPVTAALSQSNTFPSSGNVGVGTTNPQARLDVNDGFIRVDEGYGIQFSRSYPEHHGSIQVSGSGNDTIMRYHGYYGHRFSTSYGDKLSILRNGNVGISTTSPAAKLDVNGQIVGGFGAVTTSGVQDWNDISNARAGNGFTLLQGFHPNGPVDSVAYFHPMNFEYVSKDGSGNLTQLAIPYGHSYSINNGIYMRGRYSGDWTGWVKVLSESLNGNVGIGTLTPDHKLEVNGTIRAKEVVAETNWSDFVFEDGYELRPLAEVENHIAEHGHLPDVPSAAEVQEKGLEMAKAQTLMMQKIEELTLYVIDLKKENAEQQALIEELVARNSSDAH